MADTSSSPKIGRLTPLVALLTMLWGTNWVMFPLAVSEVSVWTFRSICLLGSGVLLLLAARVRGLSLHVPATERPWLAAAALAYLVIWNVGSTYAAVLIPSGQAAVLGFTMPLWAIILSWMFRGDRPSRRQFLSALLAGVGVACLAYGARNTYGAAPLGFLLGLAAGLGWACGTLILKSARLSIPPLVSAGWQLVIAAVPICAVALMTGSHEIFLPSWKSVAVIFYITVVPMAVGNIAWFSIVNILPASVSGLSTVMVPMVAMLSGALVRNEPLGALQFAAMTCCTLSLILVLSDGKRGPASLAVGRR